MLDRVVLRVGAAAAMVSAVTAIVFNLLHPRGDDVSVAGTVRLAGEGGLWTFDHYMLGWAVGLGLFGLVVISRSFVSEPSASWGRVARPYAIGGTAIVFATIVVDGFAVREAAVETGSDVALAVGYLGMGLFVGSIGLFFGLTPVLYGIAVLTGDDYPGWLGWVAVVAGLLGIVTGSIIFFDGASTFTLNVLFPIASILLTVWIGLMGWQLWQRAGAPAAERTPAA